MPRRFDAARLWRLRAVEAVTAPKARPWTRDEHMTLAELIQAGATDAQIGRALRRSAEAVSVRRKRLGLPSRTSTLNSAARAAERLGFGCGKKTAHMIRLGLLRGRRGQVRGPNRQWYVTDAALYDFVAKPEAWPMFDVERIADVTLRLWARECRRERYLTTGEVGKRYYVGSKSVVRWIELGLLRGVRWGNWRVPESALRDFVPPIMRARVKYRMIRFTPEEDARLLAMRERGRTWSHIAYILNRSVSSVHGRYERLQARATAPGRPDGAPSVSPQSPAPPSPRTARRPGDNPATPTPTRPRPPRVAPAPPHPASASG